MQLEETIKTIRHSSSISVATILSISYFVIFSTGAAWWTLNSTRTTESVCDSHRTVMEHQLTILKWNSYKTVKITTYWSITVLLLALSWHTVMDCTLDGEVNLLFKAMTTSVFGTRSFIVLGYYTCFVESRNLTNCTVHSQNSNNAQWDTVLRLSRDCAIWLLFKIVTVWC